MGERRGRRPGPGQVRLKQHAVGVNFIDTYQRSGLYKLPLPLIPGNEGAGEVVAVGPGVTDFKVGDRGAYAGAVGGYAEERLMPADRLVKLPDAIDYETAAAMMLQGMTVRYLLRQTYKVRPAPPAAACRRRRRRADRRQWAKHLGATVIGTAGSDEKAKLALGAGCTPRHQLQDRGLREAHARSSPAARAGRRLRRRRQGHLPGLARLPEAARHVRELRQRLRRRRQHFDLLAL